MDFKPTLAVTADLSKIKYPVYASAKLDGVRCSIVNGRALSRTLKAIPNRHIRYCLEHAHLNGLDGELIVGKATDPTCYNDTVSNVMAFDKVPNFTFYVFDVHNMKDGYRGRLHHLTDWMATLKHHPYIKQLGQKMLFNEDELLEFEAEKVAKGFEGIILRGVDAPYKFGRSTVKEGYLLKVKRFADSEAEIVGVEEEMFNGNEAQVNELGRTKRSTAKAGLSGKGVLGAFLVRDVNTGIEFSVGTGLTAEQRADFWKRRDECVGEFIKYKHFPVGVKTAPRHPVFLGFRDARDM